MGGLFRQGPGTKYHSEFMPDYGAPRLRGFAGASSSNRGAAFESFPAAQVPVAEGHKQKLIVFWCVPCTFFTGEENVPERQQAASAPMVTQTLFSPDAAQTLQEPPLFHAPEGECCRNR